MRDGLHCSLSYTILIVLYLTLKINFVVFLFPQLEGKHYAAVIAELSERFGCVH